MKQRIEIEFYEFDDKRIKEIARIFAYDLRRYADNGGDMKSLTATNVYGLLHQLDDEAKQKK